MTPNSNALRITKIALAVWLLSGRPVQAQDAGWYRVSLITAVAAHGADLSSTSYCLGARTCVETNPWLGHFTTQPATFGAAKMGIAGIGLWATSKIPNRRLATVVNFAVTGVFTSVAIRNARIGR